MYKRQLQDSLEKFIELYREYKGIICATAVTAVPMSEELTNRLRDKLAAVTDVYKRQVFEHLHEQNNGSIMIISHQERILNIADEIVIIADGQVRCV